MDEADATESVEEKPIASADLVVIGMNKKAKKDKSQQAATVAIAKVEGVNAQLESITND